MDPKAHWKQVYATKAPTVVSWFQPEATRSLRLIRETGAGPASAIIDVGGGASTLVDGLLAAGHRDVTVLDLSAEALAAAATRLGPAGAGVQWQEADVTAVDLPPGRFDVWHDRAVFHFLTAADQRAAYLRAVLRALKPGGHLIVATFAEDGPEKCSGLPVCRYSPEGLAGEFGAWFEPIRFERELHTTPSGGEQRFVYGVFLRRSAVGPA